MSSSSSAAPVGLDAVFPIARGFLDARPADPVALAYGGALPPVSAALRADLRSAWNLDVVHDPAAPDPLASRAFGILYGHLRAEQVVLALSARTNLTLAGGTVRIVGDGPLAAALTTVLRRLGAAVVRATDDPTERLAARLDGVRVEAVAAVGAAPLTVLAGVGHDGVTAFDVRGLVADASPRPVDATDLPSPRPHVRTTPNGSLVEIPPPLPVEGQPPTAAQLRLADALVAALISGDDAAFASAVTP
ncbi:hypothetical protein [Microbacterium sp. RURRCA19A]|uniref:hypothetical protein n=1 Tax=Microbacterium sp. RURRCA19A TaxID=1907391 RepID=UPI0009552A42|nr:hypothetical protein [Microbacterium sp. RURRCA19A]SIS18476.1 hypothetical protein SAMN05880568_3376 [Microbacterium sp. RURRCA19A]